MSDFEKVSEELRSLPARGGPDRPISGYMRALLDGETIFLPLNGEPYAKVQNRIRTSLSHHQMKLSSRVYKKDGVDGLVLWAEPKVPA